MEVHGRFSTVVERLISQSIELLFAVGDLHRLVDAAVLHHHLGIVFAFQINFLGHVTHDFSHVDAVPLGGVLVEEVIEGVAIDVELLLDALGGVHALAGADPVLADLLVVVEDFY